MAYLHLVTTYYPERLIDNIRRTFLVQFIMVSMLTVSHL